MILSRVEETCSIDPRRRQKLDDLWSPVSVKQLRGRIEFD